MRNESSSVLRAWHYPNKLAYGAPHLWSHSWKAVVGIFLHDTHGDVMVTAAPPCSLQHGFVVDNNSPQFGAKQGVATFYPPALVSTY